MFLVLQTCTSKKCYLSPGGCSPVAESPGLPCPVSKLFIHWDLGMGRLFLREDPEMKIGGVDWQPKPDLTQIRRPCAGLQITQLPRW